MEPQTPASLTTLFDLKVKQQVTNNTIFSNATQVFDHKLGNFRKCTLRNPISHKKIGIEYFSGLLSNSIWGWGTHDRWIWKDQEFLHHSYLRRRRMQKRYNQPRNSEVGFYPIVNTKRQILFDFILFLSSGMHLWGSMWSLKIVSKISLPKSSNWTFRNAWKRPSSRPSKDASKMSPICERRTIGSSSTSSTTYSSANSPTSKWFKSLIPRTSEGMFHFLRILNFLCVQFQFFTECWFLTILLTWQKVTLKLTLTVWWTSPMKIIR